MKKDALSRLNQGLKTKVLLFLQTTPDLPQKYQAVFVSPDIKETRCAPMKSVASLLTPFMFILNKYRSFAVPA